MSKRAWRWLLLSLVIAAPISISQAAGPAPNLPASMSHAIKIDSSRLESLRREYERSKGQGASEEDFMFSWLPARIFSTLLYGDFKMKDLPSDFGLLYWSGFDGGVWLNEILHSSKCLGIGLFIRLLKGPMLYCLDLDKIPSRRQLIESGSASQKQEDAQEAIKFLAWIYGYNRGFLLEILKHPPAGTNTPENILVCREFLDCRYGVGDQAILAPLLTVRTKLASPPNTEWQDVAATVKQRLPWSLRGGSWMWKPIMTLCKFSPDSYLALLNFSARFLMLNEAVMLKACQAVAEKDQPQLERALAADAAFRLGLDGYLIGLGKKIPAQ